MLVAANGQLTGAISGGCLEGDALRKAMLVMQQQQSKLITYDTTDEEDATIDIQLGCAGIIQVLFEPVLPHTGENAITLLRKAVAKRQRSVLVTLFNLANKRGPQPGTCLLVEADGTMSSQPAEAEAWLPYLITDARQVLQGQQNLFKTYRHKTMEVTAFFEYLQPPVYLIIIGAGNDAVPMVQIATTLGWEVTVVDGRQTHAKPERFGSACQVLVSKPENVLQQLPLDGQTAVVMMTHNYNYDLAMLKALLPIQIPYIGMLGPRKKLDRMLDELRAGGMRITGEMLQKVYGPTGLEIGAETPEEIALSVIAEIQAVMRCKAGSHLRNKADVIHHRENTAIECQIIPA
jgi:xanthine/CO dehydrogenase XdhC/CoxF family maturation factor